MFDDSGEFESLAGQRAMLEEEGGSDGLLRLARLIRLQERANCQDKGAVKHYSEHYNAFEDHALDSAKEGPKNVKM